MDSIPGSMFQKSVLLDLFPIVLLLWVFLFPAKKTKVENAANSAWLHSLVTVLERFCSLINAKLYARVVFVLTLSRVFVLTLARVFVLAL